MSIFFILFFLLHLSTSQLDDCTSAPCSKHGPTIRFPFRLKDNQPPHCGFPGFDLSCSPNTAATLLNLPYSVQVIVTNIDYKSQLIHIKGSNSCLLNLSTTPFQFADSVYNFSLFSCPSTIPVESFEGPWWSTPAACLSGDGQEVYVKSSGMSICYLPQLISCRKMYNVWSVPYDAFDQTADLQLTWPQPVCGNCEAEGKFCGFMSNSTSGEIECFGNLNPPKKGTPFSSFPFVCMLKSEKVKRKFAYPK
ncbi:hypothetical protein RHGRI_008694 [Rhododendron griersonianum]|uniref:RING-type E3 ubiquitin transferase n=1 Tax=Rhododendron griersonianum TaxID=479676 RepID=A0AAV6L2F0_9ERIC|nr:hypothetical protein RHGRI_008694 [Rhododendron griersonianum]